MGRKCKHFLDISEKDSLILSDPRGEVLQGCVNDLRKIFIVLFPEFSSCFTINLHSIKSTSRKEPSVHRDFKAMRFTHTHG